MQQLEFALPPPRRVYTVSELNEEIRTALERSFSDLWVAGEISGSKMATSGHCYFTLKDRGAQLRCACYRATLRYLRFKPQDGVAVIARGRIDVYEARGEYQLLVDVLEPQGHGALQLAFEQLKGKLAAEGLFEQARKRALPKHPRRIGIVTSPRGAVIQDLLQILERRFPGLHIRIYPALVQGEGAVAQVCAGIHYFSRSAWPDVIIVARGGGSLEDLWTFNEEAVARAIGSCEVPVISAVGHETDFTIADFVADLRAPTPSAAAEMVIGTRQQLLDSVAGCERKLMQAIRFRLSEADRRLRQRGIDRASAMFGRRIGRSLQRVDEADYNLRNQVRWRTESLGERLRSLSERLARLDMRVRLANARRRLESADASLARDMRTVLHHSRTGLDVITARLQQLSPLTILSRGYAIVQDGQGKVVKDAAQVSPDEVLSVRLAEGGLRVSVKDRQS
jgi:exodeoxyribonuclease VII large subunit